MNTVFRGSFARDLKRIKDPLALDRIRKVIEEVMAATTLHEVGNLKKLSGTSIYFRIRISDYRIGLAAKAETVEFIRCLPRRDLYRYFP